MNSRFLTLFVILFLAGACGDGADAAPSKSLGSAVRDSVLSYEADERDPEAEGSKKKSNPESRKISYTAEMRMQVEDYSAAAAKIRASIDQTGGYLLSARENHREGVAISGYWTLRIPAEQRAGFLDGVAALGRVLSRNLQSNDVTDQWADVDSRLASQKKLEERYLALLASRDATLAEILQIETHLAEVRRRIERLEGSKRGLVDRVAFMTVTLSIGSRDVMPTEEPGFGAEAKSAWSRSLQGFIGFLRSLAMVVVMVVPWLPLIALIYFALRLIFRGFKKS